jgi:hypothetical protein
VDIRQDLHAGWIKEAEPACGKLSQAPQMNVNTNARIAPSRPEEMVLAKSSTVVTR